MNYFRLVNSLLLLLTTLLIGAVTSQKNHAWLSSIAYSILASSFDWHTQVNLQLQSPPQDDQITLVEIDDETLSKTAKSHGRWPWRRDYQVDLLQRIIKRNPKNLIIDIVYSERDRPLLPEGLTRELPANLAARLENKYDADSRLLHFILKNQNKTILTAVSQSSCRPNECSQKAAAHTLGPWTSKYFAQSSERWLQQLPSLANPQFPGLIEPLFPYDGLFAVTKYLGLSMTIPDSDGIIRRYYPFFSFGVWTIPTISALVNPPEALDLATPEKFIKYYPPNYFSRVSALDLIQSEAPELDALIEGKIVILGMTATSGTDIHNTPRGLSTGPEILATTIQNDRTNDYIRQTPQIFALLYLLIALAFFVIGFVFEKRGTAALLVVYFILSLLSLAVIDVIAFRNNFLTLSIFLFIQNLALFITIIVFRYREEEKRKSFIKKAFASYISPKLVEQMVQDPTLLKLGGQKKELTIMFSDIRSFTSFSEKMDPKDLGDFLNEYLTAMTDIVFETDGTLDKYIGDAVMAFWGAPVDAEKHALKAIQAAILMMKWIDEKRKYVIERYQVPLEVGIGINTGVVSVGNLGSQKSLAYTVIGDDVNLSSRLEGATKVYGVNILTTENTISQLSAEELRTFQLRKLDFLTVKGRTKPVRVFEVFFDSVPEELLTAFEEAMGAYLKQNWGHAISLFEKCNQLAQTHLGREDKTALIFIERVNYLSTHPPGDNWDGAWKLDSK